MQAHDIRESTYMMIDTRVLGRSQMIYAEPKKRKLGARSTVLYGTKSSSLNKSSSWALLMVSEYGFVEDRTAQINVDQ